MMAGWPCRCLRGAGFHPHRAAGVAQRRPREMIPHAGTYEIDVVPFHDHVHHLTAYDIAILVQPWGAAKVDFHLTRHVSTRPFSLRRQPKCRTFR